MEIVNYCPEVFIEISGAFQYFHRLKRYQSNRSIKKLSDVVWAILNLDQVIGLLIKAFAACMILSSFTHKDYVMRYVIHLKQF